MSGFELTVVGYWSSLPETHAQIVHVDIASHACPTHRLVIWITKEEQQCFVSLEKL
jgi:hypothetical protein